MKKHINDLRSAIELLKRHEGQYLETSHPVDPDAELAGVYRHIGAGGTVKLSEYLPTYVKYFVMLKAAD